MGEKSFGEFIREQREARKISLRKFAERVDLSPTFVSKMERGEMLPPSEDKIKAIAEALGQDPDEMLALAGKVSSDLPAIIRQHPREMATFLRTARNLSAEQILDLTRQLTQQDDEEGF
jgi:transcriptional regulator with XRE-family HTH domain